MAKEKNKIGYAPLPCTSIQRAEQAYNSFRITVRQDTPKEALKDARYWANVASYLHHFDIVQVVPEDGSWFAELFVVDKGDNWAKMQILRLIDLHDIASAADYSTTEYAVKWKGPVRKWCVIREKDKSLIKEDLISQAEGSEWLRAHLKTLAA